MYVERKLLLQANAVMGGEKQKLRNNNFKISYTEKTSNVLSIIFNFIRHAGTKAFICISA